MAEATRSRRVGSALVGTRASGDGNSCLHQCFPSLNCLSAPLLSAYPFDETDSSMAFQQFLLPLSGEKSTPLRVGSPLLVPAGPPASATSSFGWPLLVSTSEGKPISNDPMNY